ncbi:MAG: addiction module protein [Myxococcota bacterium]
MHTSSEQVIHTAMELPLEARARLNCQLLLSLEPEDADEDSEALCLRELEARMDRLEKGEYPSQDWQESVTWLRSRLKGSL